MTKKHFQAVAQAVRRQRNDADGPEALSAIDGLIWTLADVFSQFNPRFDRSRFFAACGYRQELDGIDLNEAEQLAE